MTTFFARQLRAQRLVTGMLGPNDIDDWRSEDEDRLRAEIRLLPIVQWFRREPKAAAKQMDRALAARLKKFSRDSALPENELAALLDDLRKIRSAEG